MTGVAVQVTLSPVTTEVVSGDTVPAPSGTTVARKVLVCTVPPNVALPVRVTLPIARLVPLL